MLSSIQENLFKTQKLQIDSIFNIVHCYEILNITTEWFFKGISIVKTSFVFQIYISKDIKI